MRLELHPKQSRAFKTRATEVLYGGAAGGGKMLALDTPIPTPDGWTTMGAIAPGDLVFGSDGRPTRVIATHPIDKDPESFRMVLDDGSEFLACRDHQWHTFNAAELSQLSKRSDEYRKRRREMRQSRVSGNKSERFTRSIVERNQSNPPKTLPPPTGGVRTTAQISDTLKIGGRSNHAIRSHAGLELSESNLPLDPYLFGLWLGDGHTDSAGFTTQDKELVQAWADGGFRIEKRASKYGYGIHGLAAVLKTMEVLGDKHIPMAYLRASREQRLALLRGLMDTDGHACAGGGAEFTSVRERLATDVHELIVSLGHKASITVGKAVLGGVTIGPKYRIKWTPFDVVFRLPYKVAAQKVSRRRTTRFRYVKECRRHEPVPMRCITVAAEDGLFLAGPNMVPTHNSHLMRVSACRWCFEVPGIRVYLFRKHYPDLIANHLRGPANFWELLGELIERGHCKISEINGEIRFWNGSSIKLSHLTHDSDLQKYQGAEIHVLMVDELTHFTEHQYNYLRGRVRLGGLKVPDKHKGRLPRIEAGSNPGSIGHAWVKANWLYGAAPLAKRQMPPTEGGMVRQYIPARLDDNPTLLENDPHYADKLSGLGSPELVRALRDGDWDIVAGQAFEMWRSDKHIIDPIELPTDWMRFRSLDWGSTKPFSVGWWAVSGGEIPEIPAGALVRYREWYGWTGEPDKGLRLNSEEVARGILERTPADEEISYTIADPAIFSRHDGPTVAEKFAIEGLHCTSSVGGERINSRKAGYQEMRSRLKGEDGRPMLYVFSSCREGLIRTLPELVLSSKDPEDIDTTQEDHAYDESRYAVMSRPWQARPKARRREADRWQRVDKRRSRSAWKVA